MLRHCFLRHVQNGFILFWKIHKDVQYLYQYGLYFLTKKGRRIQISFLFLTTIYRGYVVISINLQWDLLSLKLFKVSFSQKCSCCPSTELLRIALWTKEIVLNLGWCRPWSSEISKNNILTDTWTTVFPCFPSLSIWKQPESKIMQQTQPMNFGLGQRSQTIFWLHSSRQEPLCAALITEKCSVTQGSGGVLILHWMTQ